MKKLNEYIDDYAEYHQKRSTKITHYFGIPMVMIGLLIGLQWLQIAFGASYSIPLNWVLFIGALILYARLDLAFTGVVAALLIVPMLLVAWLTPYSPTFNSLIAFAVFFIGGWILQLTGHIFEGRRPAFADNIIQLLIAPLFLVVELMESKLAEKYFPKLSSSLLLRLGKEKDAKF